MSIEAMIKQVTAKDIKKTVKAVKNFEAGAPDRQMIMIAFD